MFKWVKNTILGNWKFFAGLIVPLALIPIIFIPDGQILTGDGAPRPATKFRTLYVVSIMAIFWAFEIIPLAVTALIPLVLFPILGVESAYYVSENYMKESNMIFLSAMIIAIGVEYCGLHTRVALRVMTWVEPSPLLLLFGTMAITAFLAMWITATACVAILVPVVVAIIDEIHESPEVLSNSEIRRLSTAGVLSMDPGGGDNGSSAESGAGGRRRSSLGSGIYHNNQRRNTTVFGNNAFVSPPRVSNAYIDKSSRSNSLHPVPESRSPSPGRKTQPPNTNISDNPDPNAPPIYPVLIDKNKAHLYDNADKQSLSNSVTFSLTVPDDDELVQNRFEHDDDEDVDIGSERYAEKIAQEQVAKQDKRDNIKKMFLFGMAYAANIGGTAVITGTSPNKIFKEVLRISDIYPPTFFKWMALNVPAMLLNIIIAWVYLAIAFYGLPNRRNWPFLRKLCCLRKVRDESEDVMSRWKSREVKYFLRREYQKLGSITQHEISVLIIFLGVVMLWVFRSPGVDVINGWEDSVPQAKPGESTGAMLGVLLLFLFPKNWRFILNRGNSETPIKFEPLLDWKFVTAKMPWGYLILLGSGFAIASASEHSGLSAWIGEELELLSEIPDFALLIIVVVLTSILAEVVSNVACANIILPVIVSVSKSLDIHPFSLTIPVALACQYAFLFPIATPSNAIVFAAGNFSTVEMVRTGLFLNVICIVVVVVNTITYGNWLFEYSDYEYE